jgi:hypothetical protein
MSLVFVMMSLVFVLDDSEPDSEKHSNPGFRYTEAGTHAALPRSRYTHRLRTDNCFSHD